MTNLQVALPEELQVALRRVTGVGAMSQGAPRAGDFWEIPVWFLLKASKKHWLPIVA